MMSSFKPSSSAARLRKAARWRSRLHVERVDMKLVLPRHQHIHLHQLVAEILLQAADAVAAVAVLDDDLVAMITAVPPVTGFLR